MLANPSEFAAICAKTICSQEFDSLRGSEAQIEFIFKKVKSLQEFREELSNYANKYREDHKKSLKTARKYRQEADIYFAAKDYGRAVQHYSYALVNAPFPTEGTECKELQICYTARSKAFLAMRDFDNALFDTERSLFLGTDIDMLVQKARCLIAVQRFGDAKMLIDGVLHARGYWDLSERPDIECALKAMKEVVDRSVFAYGSNHKSDFGPKKHLVPDYDIWVDHRFEMKDTEDKGRAVVVKEKISKGEVIIAERLQNAVLSAQNTLTFCSNCFKQIGYQFWPCVWCNEVVFCDRECHDQGLADFHYYECTIQGLLVYSPMYQMYRAVTRIGAEKAFELGTKDDRGSFDYKKWVKRFYCRDVDPIYRGATIREEREHHFEALLGLTDHDDHVSAEESVKQHLIAIETALLIENKDQFKTYDPKKFTKFVSFLVKMFRKSLTNSFSWNQVSPYGYTNRVGSCVAVYGAMLNHSCLPNSFWQFVEDKIIFTTMRDVEEGEELTISYGPCYQQPLNERQAILRNNYHFVCKCDLCKLQISAYPALKCSQCEGPVLFLPNANNPDVCMDCGTKFDNIQEVLHQVASHRITLDEEMKRVQVLMEKKKLPQRQSFVQKAYPEDDEQEAEEYIAQFEDGQPEVSAAVGEEPVEPEEPEPELEETKGELEDDWRTRLPEIKASLAKAESALKSIIDLHYKKVDEIFDLEMQLSKLCVKADCFEMAVPHFQRIIASTDWSKCGKTCRHWDDLLFITNTYFQRLKDEAVTKKSEWKQCFKSFSALKEGYKTIKSNDKSIQATQVLAVDGKPVESVDAVKELMREKKANFSTLKDVYRKLFTA